MIRLSIHLFTILTKVIQVSLKYKKNSRSFSESESESESKKSTPQFIIREYYSSRILVLIYVLRDNKAMETIKQEIDTYLPMFSFDNDIDDLIIEE